MRILKEIFGICQVSSRLSMNPNKINWKGLRRTKGTLDLEAAGLPEDKSRAGDRNQKH
jgi:hypothetical protein